MDTNISVNTPSGNAHAARKSAHGPDASAYMHTSTSLHQKKSSAQSQSARRKTLQMKIFDAIITVSITALFFGVPLFFTSLTMQGIAFDKQIYFYFWILVAVVAWATKSAVTGELTLKRTPLDYPILGLLVVAVVSAYLSADRWHSLWGAFGDPSRGLIAIVASIVAFYIIVTHFTWHRFRVFFGALLLSGAIVVVWTFLGLLGIGFLPDAIAAYAPLSLIGSLRGLGLFISAMIPLFITGIFGLWRDDVEIPSFVRYIGSFLLGSVVLIALIDILSLLSYTPLVALAIGVAFFLIFILAQIVRPHGALSFIPMIVLLVVAGFLMTNSPQNTLSRLFVSDSITLPPDVIVDKSLSWDIAKASMKENFFFGYGPAQYGHAFSMTRPESLNEHPLFTLRFMQGEGALFDGVVTLGVVGVVFMVLVFVTFFGVSIYLITRNQEYNKLYSLGFVSAILILGVAAVMYRIDGGIALFGVLIAAIGWSVLYHESKMSFSTLALSLKASPKFALSLAFISIVLIAGVGMSFFFIGKMFVADVFAGKAVHAQEVTNDTIRYLGRAINLNDREGRYLTRIGQEYMVLANREALKPEDERDLQALRAYLQSAQIAALNARTILPADVVAAETFAQIIENASYYDTNLLDEADEAYRVAQDLEPSNPLYLQKRGEIALRKALLIDAKDEDARNDALAEARDLFGEAIDKKKNLAPAYYQRALIQQALGNIDDAIADMERAFASSNNSDVTYAYNLGVLYKERDGENDAARAELLFRSILGVNDKEINAHLELATLYEQKKEVAAAIAEYKKVLELLPEDGENIQAARENIQSVISRLEQSSVSVAPNGEESAPTVGESQGDAPATDAPTVPVSSEADQEVTQTQ